MNGHWLALLALIVGGCGSDGRIDVDLQSTSGCLDESTFFDVASIEIFLSTTQDQEVCYVSRACLDVESLTGEIINNVESDSEVEALLRMADEPFVAAPEGSAEFLEIVLHSTSNCGGAEACGRAALSTAADGVLPMPMSCETGTCDLRARPPRCTATQ